MYKIHKRHLALTALTAALLMGSTAITPAHAEGPPPPEAGAPDKPGHDGPGKPEGKHGGKHGDRGAKMFEEADKNKDGALTKQEMLDAHKDRVDDMFEKLDTDKSGTLSKAELDKGREEMRNKMKERYKDKEGKRGGPKDEKPGDKPE